MCSDNGRGSGSFPSWGRRRRRRDADDELEAVESNQHSVTIGSQESDVKLNGDSTDPNILDKEEVRKMLGVLPSRAEAEALRKALRKERELNVFNEYLQSREKQVDDPAQLRPKMSASRLNDGHSPTIHKMDEICVTQVHYYSLLVTLILLIIWLGLAIAYFILHTRRKIEKIKVASMANLVQQSADFRPTARSNRTADAKSASKSIATRETIYSDVSMVERPRSVSETNYGSVLMNIY